MARLQLYLHQLTPAAAFRFVRPDGASYTLPRLRLVTYANLSPVLVSNAEASHLLVQRCIIDTGSHLTTIPERVWQHFRTGAVTPLAFPADTPSDEKRLVVAGGVYAFTLGELVLRLEDQSRRHLTVTVVAQLTRDGGRLRIPVTIGLRGGVIDGRTLSAAPDPRSPFGQRWMLEDG